jgi:amino acid adenylation domain-containing protein
VSNPSTFTAARSAEDRRRQLAAMLQKKANKSRSFPLSSAQQRLWILDRLDPGNPVYNIPLAIRLRGPLDLDALHRTLNEVIARHESLRTKIVMTGDQPMQVIEAAKPQRLSAIDLEHIEPAEREAEAAVRAEAEARKPFRLDEAPLFRALLLRFSSAEHVLVVVMHHIISDEWSMAVLFREVALLYKAFCSGQASPLEPLPVQYADYADWQRRRLQGETLQRLLDYWCGRLRDIAPLELPTDQSRSLQPQQAGGAEDMHLPLALVDRLREMGRRESATLYMTLLAALQVLLYRYSGQEDFTIGSPIAGRVGKDTEGLVGFFVNTLVMRADVAGDPSFRSLLRHTRQTALEAFQHQELPFERLVDALNPDRGANRNPLFQVMFTLHNAPLPEVTVAGLSLSVIPLETGMSKFELSFTVRDERDGLLVSADYRSDLFRPGTIQRMLKCLRVLLEGIVAEPDLPVAQLPLLTETERRQVLIEWNDTAREYPAGLCVHEWFERQAERTPHALALIDGPRQWTYQELDERANRLAHYLQRRGVGPDRIVAVRLTRSAELIAGLLGVLKAGGAYLPLDPESPAERLRFILDDARVEILVTQQSLCSDLPAGLPHVICLDTDWKEIATCLGEPPARQTTSEHLAYVIYTSGSTGRPKGVMIEHRALMNYTQAAVEQYGITAADRVLQFAAASFDAHVEEVFPCLTHGGALVLRNDDMLDCKTFLQLCQQWQLTFVTLPTGFWHELTTAIAAERLVVPAAVRLLVIGGEQAQPERVAAWFHCVGSRVRLLNTYGPTETTVVATAAELGPADGRENRVPIGRPLGNMRVYVLDCNRQPVPVGVPGELHVGGESLARGYLNRPELTGERFVADPFAAKAGARMYKTGDVVHWRDDGRLEFIGRTDHQVKIRGFRIEPGEVEQVLREHPLLADAVVTARERGPGDLQLVAYMASRGDAIPTATEIRQFLSQRLPDFMIPIAFVTLDSLPITASGKVDRRALPEPDWEGGGAAREGDFVAPRTPTEVQLTSIWSEVLSIEGVGANDNFFDLGGNSLLAVRLVAYVRKVFSVDLPLAALFATPTVAELAEQIVSLQASSSPCDLPPIRPVARDVPPPISYSQEPFWVISHLQQGPPPYAFHPVLRMNGPLDVSALDQALNEIFRRHESLRTTFGEAGDDVVQVIAPYQLQQLKVVDLSTLPAETREEEVRRYAKAESERPIDLAKGPLMRLELLRLSGEEHVVLVGMHHIIYDGWSIDVLARELVTAYLAFTAGLPSPLAELPIQYADFAVWQRERLQGEVLDRLRRYWLKQLEGLPTLELPTDRPRPAVRTTHSAVREHQLSQQLNQAVGRLSNEEGATKFMTVLAAFQTLLHRYSGQDDFAVSTPAAGRLRPETESLVGCFINDLVLRADLSGDPSFRQLLGRVRETVLEAFDHQEMPFMRLVRELNPPRDPSRRTLVQTELIFHSVPRVSEQLPGVEVSDLRSLSETEGADFDLCLEVYDGEQGLQLRLCYHADLFDEATIVRMLEHFQAVLEAAIADPDRRLSQLPLITDCQREQVLVEWNQTQVDFPQQGCVHQLFETQVERDPDAVALVFEGRTVTYRQLNARANQLAHYLASREVGPEVLVGICLEPSLDLAVALLGVLKAGGAYVPLDPEDPRERIDYFLADSRPAVILTTAGLADRFSPPDARVVQLDAEREDILREGEADMPCRATPENAICVLYTSGSTGKPKGVVSLHRGICNYLLAKQQLVGLGPADRVLLATPISFDTSVEEVFLGLTCGGCLVIEKAGGTRRDMSCLVQLIARENVTTACFVPSKLRLLLEEEHFGQCRSLKRVLVGGEVLTPDLVERFFHRLDAELYNEYGPTEASIDVAVWKCRLDYQRGIIPIGRPIANVRLYVLDAERNPVPVGVPGELYIGGVAVARGYLNRPELSTERFLPDSFSGIAGDLLYRTGDRCRWLPDGNIEFLGRRDGQVKIHGGRLELGEVEAAISRYPAVAHAAVVVRQSSPDYKYLAAYVVPRGRRADSVEARTEFVKDLRQFLKSSLPEYMIPQAFEVLDALPQLPSGKLDRAALPAAAPTARPARRYVAPRSILEQQLAAIWAELLGRDRVGVYDNFFELGGHSLLAVQAITRTCAALGADLPAATLFVAPTIAAMAERIEAAQRRETNRIPRETPIPDDIASTAFPPSTGGRQSLVPLRSGGTATPLFCIHGLGGHVGCFLPLACGLAEPRPVYGLQGHGLDAGQRPHDRIEDMAAFYLQEIREVQPRGPYLLAGWSMGGLIALETAERLRAAGEEVVLVAMLDTDLSADGAAADEMDDQSTVRWLVPHLNLSWAELKGLPPDRQWQRIAERADLAGGIGGAEIRRLAEVCRAHLAAFARYQPRSYQGRAVLFRAEDARDLDPRWKSLCPRLRMEAVPGNHYSMLRKPHVETLIDRLNGYLREGAVDADAAGDL